MTQKTDQEYVQDLLEFIGSKRYNSLIIDPSASSLIVAARRAGIVTKKANNDVEEGIRMVYSLLSTGHIKINKDNCPNLISEIGLYIWDSPKGERGQEKPLKQNDHALDALRYLVRSTSYPSEVFA